MTVRLIMSGATCEAELAAEFGPLPPAFLPVGAQRLYELQLASLFGGGPVHLTLPEDFEVPPHDAERLAELGVEIVPVPAGLRLGEAVVYALNAIAAGDRPVHILHGDTLLGAPPLDAADVIVGGPRANEYAWAEMAVDGAGRITALTTTAAGEEGAEDRPIAAGYFAFGSGLALVRSLARMRGDFIAGLNHYLAERPVTLAPAEGWLDFGHLQTFFQSRLAVSTARAFNTVRIDGLTARKSSRDQAKIWAEAHWLQEAPPKVQLHAVRLLAFGRDEDQVFYETEYQHLPVLSELFVYGSLGRRPWLRILAACEAFLAACAAEAGPGSGDAALKSLCLDKTLGRLAAYARASGFPVDRPLTFEGRPAPSLTRMAERLAGAADADRLRQECVMHGDFCFSNILYDSRVRRIKAIDPRGLVGEKPTLYGDLRYDLAKLAHSIWGRYDQIIAGRARVNARGCDFAVEFEPLPAQGWLQDALAELRVDGVGGLDADVKAACASLFLSMIPLHAERPDRQRAFVANALRLYRELDA